MKNFLFLIVTVIGIGFLSSSCEENNYYLEPLEEEIQDTVIFSNKIIVERIENFYRYNLKLSYINKNNVKPQVAINIINNDGSSQDERTFFLVEEKGFITASGWFPRLGKYNLVIQSKDDKIIFLNQETKKTSKKLTFNFEIKGNAIEALDYEVDDIYNTPHYQEIAEVSYNSRVEINEGTLNLFFKFEKDNPWEVFETLKIRYANGDIFIASSKRKRDWVPQANGFYKIKIRIPNGLLKKMRQKIRVFAFMEDGLEEQNYSSFCTINWIEKSGVKGSITSTEEDGEIED